jgi:hypothetical protein
MTTTTNLIHSRTHAPTLTTGINQSPIQLPAATALPIPVHIPTILGKPPLALNRQPSPFDGLSNQRTTAEPVVLTTQWDYQPEVYFKNSMLRKELTKVAAIVNNHGRPESRYCFPCACCQGHEHHLHQCPIFGSCWDNRQPGVMRCGWCALWMVCAVDGDALWMVMRCGWMNGLQATASVDDISIKQPDDDTTGTMAAPAPVGNRKQRRQAARNKTLPLKEIEEPANTLPPHLLSFIDTRSVAKPATQTATKPAAKPAANKPTPSPSYVKHASLTWLGQAPGTFCTMQAEGQRPTTILWVAGRLKAKDRC